MEGLTNTTLALTWGGSAAVFGIVFSCSLVIFAASLGISRIGSKALESLARQPEAGERIFSTMIIAAALLEGVTFFALLICFMALFWSR